MKIDTLILDPIGVVHTVFTSRYAAPRQPGTSPQKTVGTIVLHPGRGFEQATEDLAGFDYVWVLFWFNRNVGWKPKVLPPVSDRTKRGVFATRSPYRPNPLGLSLCRLLEVNGRTLTIDSPDMLDGTPILDIKPYIPHIESRPEARSGWLTEAHTHGSPPYSVAIARDVMRFLRRTNESQTETYLRETLGRDPFPHSYRRIKKLPDGRYRIAVKRLRFVYEVRGKSVRVVEGK